jgi:glycerophosphoryl diester phosphodiesterase
VTVECIAHRGDSWNHPENTRAAFDAAVGAGADGIELDVQLSRDGIPVVFHDRTLTRAGGGRRRVHALDLAELRQLDAAARTPGGRRQRIPTLDEVLGRYGKLARLLLEIKARERNVDRLRQLVDATVRSVRRHRLTRRIAILCFEIDILDHVATTAPGIRRVLNVDRKRRGRLWRVIDRVDAVSADVKILDTRFVRRLRLHHKPLLVYTCNTARHLRTALEAGAGAIMSDRPGWLCSRLRGPGGHP